MGKRMRVVAFLLVLSILAGCLPSRESRAADDFNFTCQTKSGTTNVVTGDEAFDVLEKEGGGTITVSRTTVLFTEKVRQFTNNMKIVVPENMTLTFGGAGIQGNGKIEVYGTLDLKNSTCSTFHVTGEMLKMSRGVIERLLVNVGTLETPTEPAATIIYGQKLPPDNISDTLVGMRVYKGGNWHFTDQTTIFPAGTHSVETFYDYSKTIYMPESVTKNVQICVEKATPKLTSYTVPEVEQGKTLSTIYPKYAFTNPYTKEEIAGTFAYADAGNVMSGLGKKSIKATFTPKDSSNYNTAELLVDVNVVAASPKVVKLPVTNSGTYGETLKDITLSQGSCADEQTGELVDGTWTWKNEGVPLQSGEQSYAAVFTPKDTVNYKTMEVSVKVQTAPKKMTAVEWPSVSEMKEGQHLFEAKLSFDANEYGRFVWEDETLIPSVEYKGATLIFVPYDAINYDWSFVNGYDAETKNIKKTVALQIAPKPTATPEPTNTPEPAVTATPAPTKEPEVTEAPVSSTPLPTKEPEVTEAPMPPTPSPTKEPQVTEAPMPPTPSPTKEPEVTEAPASTKEPEVTEAPVSTKEPEITETPVSTKEPEVTEAPVSTKEPEVTETPVSTKEPEVTKEPVPTKEPEVTQKPSNTEEPVIIKKMVSKISKIKTPKSGKAAIHRSQIRKIKRVGRSIKIIIKKKKGAKYVVRYSRKKNMKKAKKKRSSKHIIYLRKLKAGKSYYIQARIWKKSKGKRIYGKWSKRRKV